jgi:MFS family permease
VRAFFPLFRIQYAPLVIIGSVIARLAYGVIAISLLLLVSEQHGVGLGGTVVGANALGAALLATHLGRWLDNYGPRRVLPIVGILSSVGLLALFILPPVLLIPCAFIAGMFEPPNMPAIRTWWWRQCTTDELRRTANAWEGMMSALCFGIAPVLLAAPMIALWGSGISLLVGIALNGLAPLVFIFRPLAASWQGRATSTSGSLSSPWKVLRLRYLAVIMVMNTASASALVPICAVIALARHNPEEAAVLIGLLQPGTLVGGIWYGTHGRKYMPLTVLAWALAGLGATMFFAMLVHPLWALALALCLFGLARAPTGMVIYYLVACYAPVNQLSEANGMTSTSIFLGFTIGPVTSGLLVASFGPAAGFLIIMVFASIGLACTLRLRALE